MRRSLDWMVVSIALLVLFANRLLVERPGRQERIEPPSTTLEWRVAPAESASPFAWIQEDGTEVAVPARRPNAGHASGGIQPRHAARAVHTWSAPLAEAQPPRSALQ